MRNNSPLKSQLADACSAPIVAQLQQVEQSLARLHADKAAETKSSAGDKYETGRAMLQREEAQLYAQQARLRDTLLQLDRVRALPPRAIETVGLGSLVHTTQGRYWMAAAVGRVPFGELGESVFCISPASPIGQLLLGARAGDSRTFNGRTITVTAVEG